MVLLYFFMLLIRAINRISKQFTNPMITIKVSYVFTNITRLSFDSPASNGDLRVKLPCLPPNGGTIIIACAVSFRQDAWFFPLTHPFYHNFPISFLAPMDILVYNGVS